MKVYSTIPFTYISNLSLLKIIERLTGLLYSCALRVLNINGVIILLAQYYITQADGRRTNVT